jgi:hypothetical protein
MHFPLRKGTEVLLTFIDGDPDRPIIASAVPNPEHPSMVSSANHTMSGIRTASGNQFTIQDREGERRIALSAAGGQSQIVCSEGNSGIILQQADYNQRSSTYINSAGSLMGASLGGIGQSIVAHSWLWSAVKAAADKWLSGVSQVDALGQEFGLYPDGDEAAGYNKNMLLSVTIGTMALDYMFNVWMVNNLAASLKKKNLHRAGSTFGPSTQRELLMGQDWTDRIKQVWLDSKAIYHQYLKAATGSYGVLLTSACGDGLGALFWRADLPVEDEDAANITEILAVPEPTSAPMRTVEEYRSMLAAAPDQAPPDHARSPF